MCIRDRFKYCGFPRRLKQLSGKIKSFKVNLVPIPEFNEGDIVWSISRHQEGKYIGFQNGWGHLVQYDSNDDEYNEFSNLILIEKGEINNE